MSTAVLAPGTIATRRLRLGRRQPDAGALNGSLAAAGAQALEIEHLHKRYGERVALSDVSLSVARGEIFGILGPNGAGKTTTVECAQGLRRADGGTIRTLGLSPTRDAQSLRGRVASQLQASALPDRMKVWEALDLFAALSPHPADWRSELERWGLAEQRRTSFANLSGGQRQRLFLALALLGAPELVFLDELTQGLDPDSRRQTWNLIQRIRDGGCTVVLVTHCMDEAERLCDRVAIIDGGRVIASGSPQQLIAASRAEVRVRFSTDRPDLSWLDHTDGVREVVRRRQEVEVLGGGALLASVAATLMDHGIAPADLRVERPTLEDAYISLLGATSRGQG